MSNTLELIDLFYREMANQIYNAPIEQPSISYLIDCLDETKQIVLETYSADRKK